MLAHKAEGRIDRRWNYMRGKAGPMLTTKHARYHFNTNPNYLAGVVLPRSTMVKGIDGAYSGKFHSVPTVARFDRR